MSVGLKTPFYMSAALVAAYSGMIQGAAWLIMAFIGIIWRIWAYDNRLVNYSTDKFNDVLNIQMFYTFISLNVKDIKDLYVQANVFLGGLIVYLFLHTVWIIASAFLYLGFTKDYSHERLFKILVTWIAVTSSVIIFDAISFGLFAHDYDFAIDEYNNTNVAPNKIAYLYNIFSYLIMMTLVARGYVLWLMNVILCGFMIKICIEVKRNPAFDTTIDQIYGTRNQANFQEFPEEFINDIFRDAPRRRRTEPPRSEFSAAATSTFRSLQRYRDINYVYDPHIENRLRKYTVTPNPSEISAQRMINSLL